MGEPIDRTEVASLLGLGEAEAGMALDAIRPFKDGGTRPNDSTEILVRQYLAVIKAGDVARRHFVPRLAAVLGLLATP
jgi:hypothetical protein